LLSAAQEGPIVVLNATELRSDAVLLTKEQVTSIPLPQLSHASIVRYLSKRSDDSNEGSANNNEAMRETLGWLGRLPYSLYYENSAFILRQLTLCLASGGLE